MAGLRRERVGRRPGRRGSRRLRSLLVRVVLVAASSACATAPRPERGSEAPAGSPPAPADVEFLSAMIPHHAQALLMAGWASTHDAGLAVRTASERITVSQRDEIEFMQRWLRDRGAPVPDAEPSGAPHLHDGHPAMPGMLTADELAELDRARGPEFDRLFLTSMIRHHRGAVVMVERLFEAPGAAQDPALYQFAADVHADQIAEIDRMSRMLADLSVDAQR